MYTNYIFDLYGTLIDIRTDEWSDKVWDEFERIQSDIFDHLMSIVSEFGLRIYQRP